MNKQTKAVFLDRDGVINYEVGDYIMRLEDFKILPHVITGLKKLQELGFLLIVVTNQGGIAKGLYTHQTFQSMHDYLDKELEKHQIKITEVYYCPHHPITSECLCRKPGSILVEKAIAKYGIDPSLSWFIGDKQRDMDAGAAAGVKGILIEPNEDWTSYINQFNTSAKQ
jgi:D-glycero-D-manno-heptose 1,7-bisphosphate phosphatase